MQLTVEIGVEEFDQVVAVSFGDVRGEAIVTYVIKKRAACEEARLIAVEPLKRGIRLEVFIRGEVLSLQLNLLLIFGDRHEQVCQ